ncbi:chemotaxis response regulator protein-glutamate methylesterase [Desulfobacter postgatei]|jgi:two-component system chemotaxis response regulator CheB|uniref:protein-glutamate methylesterase/protein-glutamine glutaminase n=1 Tax=Desulfobacter postgatei TaxID=2293 RepID=UPI002A35EA92|nr:chemotaxis response regulator protein-glutamate methylesterase [Desulfobacter postgatei]MDX9964626.1 chemotaxis response regulator protein-glutamate methylesterase [Desulfobacter postgatei]
MNTIKALVVDDTIVYRKIVGDALKQMPGIEVVGTANNGKIALSKIKTLKPDLITLDIEMPEMNGIELLQELQNMDSPPLVIMVSTLTHQGGALTLRALELGAFDVLPKPEDGKMAENMLKIQKTLEPIVRHVKRHKFGIINPPARLKPAVAVPDRVSHSPAKPRPAGIRSKSEIIGIGISTGGPNALTKMIPMLPKDLKVPVLIVQHMPPVFTASLADSLNKKSALEVIEAKDGDIIKPGKVFIAPGGKQMKIVAGADGLTRKIKITDDPPENSCKPSADYLFRSIAQHYVGRSTGVIMTGMGADGSKGLVQMKNNGSFIIAQDEKTCTVYGMPKEPIESGIVDIIAPLEKIADEIVKTV